MSKLRFALFALIAVSLAALGVLEVANRRAAPEQRRAEQERQEVERHRQEAEATRALAARVHRALDEYYVLLRTNPRDADAFRDLLPVLRSIGDDARKSNDGTPEGPVKLLADAAYTAAQAVTATANMSATGGGPTATAYGETAKGLVTRTMDLLNRAGFPFAPSVAIPSSQPSKERMAEAEESIARESYVAAARSALECLYDLRTVAERTSYKCPNDILATRVEIDRFLRHQPVDYAPPSRQCIANAMQAFEIMGQAEDLIGMAVLGDTLAAHDKKPDPHLGDRAADAVIKAGLAIRDNINGAEAALSQL